MYLFFDTETTGLPRYMNAKVTDLDNWPRVIQLAWILLDENLQEVDSFCKLIKPDKWEIPVLKFWLDNGYSTEKNMKEGMPMQMALQIGRAHV